MRMLFVKKLKTVLMRLFFLVFLVLPLQPAFSQSVWQSLYQQSQNHYIHKNLQKSYQLGKRALMQAKIEYGVAHSHYADNLRLLSLICYSSAQLQQGIDYAFQEITVREQLGQKENFVYGQTLYNLGILYSAASNFDVAASYLTRALSILRNFPQEPESIAEAYFQLGKAYHGQQQWSQADSALTLAEQIAIEKNLSQDLVYHVRYQRACLSEKQTADSQLAFQQLKSEIEQQQDTLHPIYFHVIYFLATKEEEKGKWQEAGLLFEKAKDMLEVSMTDSLHYASVLDHLGVIELAKTELTKAAHYIRSAYQIRKKHLQPQRDAYWVSVDHMGQMYQKDGKKAEAIQFYEKIIREVSDSVSTFPYQYGVVLNNLALLLLESHQYQKASQYFQAALSKIEQCQSEEAKISQQQASIYYNVAKNHQRLSQFDTAIFYFKKAIDLSKTFSDGKSPAYRAALSGMASLYQDMGYFTEAEIFYREALQLQEAVSGKESNEYADLLNNFALLMQSKGDYQQAEAFLQEVIHIKQTLLGEEDLQTIAVSSNLGLFYVDMANYKEARPLLEKALAQKSQVYSVNDPALIVNLVNLAKLEAAEANYTKAEPLLKKALRIATIHFKEEHAELARIQGELANLYLALGNYPAAEPLLQESQHILRERYGSSHPDYSASIQKMAILSEATGKDSLAEVLFEESLEIDRQVLGKQHPAYAISLNNMASFYQNIGKDSAALPLLEESLTISQYIFGKEHPSYTATLLNLGLLYQELKEYAKAEPMLNEVVALRKKLLGTDHPDYAYALYGKAVLLHRLQKFEEASPLFQQVVDNYSKQIKSYFPALSEKEKSAFYKRIEPVFNAYRDFVVDLFLNKGYNSNPEHKGALLGKLYNLQLITKAMLMDASSKIRKNILQSGNGHLMQTFEEWMATKEQLAQAYTFSRKTLAVKQINLKALERKANDLEKQLSAGSVLFAKDMEKKNLTWSDIQQRLKSEEAAIEIVRGHKEKSDIIFYLALVVTPDSPFPDWVVMPRGKEMEGKNYFYYKNGIEFRVKDTLSYQMYWKPIQQVIPPKVSTMYVAPDGIYNKISLNSLYNNAEENFLIDEMNVRMLSSTRELIEEPEEGHQPIQTQAYLFGYPNYRYEIDQDMRSEESGTEKKSVGILTSSDSELYPYRFGITLLPGTQREVNYVDEILHQFQWNTFKFTENIALEENIKQVKNPGLLHIATHGYFMSDLSLEDDKKAYGIHLQSMAANPLLRSGLLLAGSELTIMASEADDEIVHERNAEDGILTAYEAMNLDLLGTDLVVLSACETGLGDVRNGEGVYGLQRAFLIAGAQSVMMSLWKVNDHATTELIKKFYANWLSGQDKSSALRNAQLAIKEEYHNPYYWGAFVLMGK